MNDIQPGVPLPTTTGQTVGNILSIVRGPSGGSLGIERPRYSGAVMDPSVQEYQTGRPATMQGIDVTSMGDPYEHEGVRNVRNLPPATIRSGFYGPGGAM